MSRFVRASKVRHLFATEPKTEQTYQNFKLSTATGDHNYIKGNALYFGIGISSGNGALAVVPYTALGKAASQPPVIDGHKGAVLDFDFSPFHDNLICTGGDDGKVMVWGIPAGGMKETMTDPLISLIGHERKINVVRYHPSADHIVATGSADETVKVWDVEAAAEKVSVGDHGGMILDIVFNYDGSQFITSGKDKNVRLIDPRTGGISSLVEAHDGTKTTKLEWLGNTSRFVTVGFNKQSKRGMKLWDSKKMDQPLHTVEIDQAAGVIMPFYDEDINVLYLAGKGDGNIRYYEIVDEDPWVFEIGSLKTNTPQKGVAMCPKRIVNTAICETTRMLKLCNTSVEPLNFIIPRKSELFQADLFPDCRAPKAALTCAEFFAGQTKPPVLMSLDPKKRTDAPVQVEANIAKVKTAAELQKELDAALKQIADLEALLKKNNIAY